MSRTIRLLAAGLALVGLTATAGAQSRAFTASERRQLVAGQLVRRDVTRNEGRNRLFGGTSWIRVRAPIDRVWRAVRDPSLYPRLIPSLDRVRVIERSSDAVVLQMHHAFGIGSADYHARMTFDDDAREVRFELDRSRPRDVREGRGFLTLSEYQGDTIVAWGMLADVGGGTLQQVFGPFLNDWLLKPPRCLRDELEPARTNEC